MEHMGDITELDGATLAPVDIITFGSPCQDLSVAGKRAGLSGERSGLFSEAIRIIDEIRRATNGKYPTWAVWENVPGALSSGQPKGADFASVLEAFTKTTVPIPRSGRWAGAGMVRGDRVAVAWRVLDAQYHGVPQRRRRIFLVARRLDAPWRGWRGDKRQPPLPDAWQLGRYPMRYLCLVWHRGTAVVAKESWSSEIARNRTI
jgi:DNA (cytosine-5)-methyltransferase 1